MVDNITAVAVGKTLPIDWTAAPRTVSWSAVVTGTETYNIEYTLDDVFDSTITPTWFAAATGQTNNQAGSIAFPISAIRVNGTAGTGAVRLTVLEGLKG